MLRTLTDIVFGFLFPEACIGCNVGGTMLCATCLKIIPPPREHSPHSVSRFNYQNPVIREAIHLFKYRNGRRIGVVLGKVLYESIADELALGGALSSMQSPLLIPIPLSRKRLKKRGFNQSEILVRHILSHSPLGMFQAELANLVRIKDTGSQVVTKNRDERMENIRGCFAVTYPARIKDKDIILIDDVTTTGATIEEARRVLLEAGARQVTGVTVAH